MLRRAAPPGGRWPARRAFFEGSSRPRAALGALAVLAALGALPACEEAAVTALPPDGAVTDWAAPELGPAPGDEAAPTVTLEGFARVDHERLRVFGVAWDDARVVALTAQVGFSGPYPVPALDPAGRFTAELPIPPAGIFVITVTATDAGGRTGRAELTVDDRPAAPGPPPALQVDWPPPEHETAAATLEIRGQAFSAAGVAAVEVNAVGRSFGVAYTQDHFARFARIIPLRPGAREVLRISARDTLGQETVVERVVTSTAAPPHGPPRITGTDPQDGAVVDTALVTLRIQVEGSAEIARVEYRQGAGPWARARPDGAEFVAPLRLAPGPNRVELLPVDVAGLSGLSTVELLRPQDGWEDGPQLSLRPPGRQAEDLVFTLDRAGLRALLPPEIQARTPALPVDLPGLLTQALRQLRAACERGCPPGLGPAERAVQAALSATALSADYDDTALGPAAALGEALFPEPFGRLIGALLDQRAGAPLLDEAALVDALTAQLQATHPALASGLQLTLADALADLAPWEARLGPAGGHPGLVAGPVTGRLFGPDLQVRLVVESDLAVFSGVDLQRGQLGFFSAPPAGQPAAALDFLDPARFAIEGLVPRPSVDLTLALHPAPARPDLALDWRAPEAAPAPAWSLDAALFAAGRQQWADLRSGCDLCGGPEAGALVVRDRAGQLDLAEAAVGRLGYACGDGPCRRRPASPPDVPARLLGLDAWDCAAVEDCAAWPGSVCHRAGRADDRGRCVPVAEIRCAGDAECGGGARCLAGRCVAPERILCAADVDCAGEGLCHDGECVAPPAGWARLWLIDPALAPPPAYAWALIADVLGAALDGADRAPAHFPLTELALGVTGAAVEASLRATLHAQRLPLAEALLGRLGAQGERVDLYLDHDEAGALWLLISGCPDPDQRCDAPGDHSLYRGARAIDRPLPDGRRGVPLAELQAADTLTLVRAGVIYRVDVVAAAPDALRLWLRGAQAVIPPGAED